MLRYQKRDGIPRYPNDCIRIARVLREEGYSVTLSQAEEMWDNFSDTYAAGWLGLDIYSDEDLKRILIDNNEGEDDQ